MMNKPGSGETAKALIRMGATDQEALELILFLYPEAKTTIRTIQSYRSYLVTDLEEVPSAKDAPGLDRDRLRKLILDGK